VANLAITFAQMGANTLLVDTDLRRPVLHGIFDLPRVEGLTNVLVGRSSVAETVRQTKIENLKILTSGTLPPNPSELLASKSMDRLIDEVSKDYDMVLFDSPPVIAVTDATVLAPKLDGVVLVVRSGVVGKEALDRSNVLLKGVNANLFGVILNGVNVDHTYYYRYYYYYGDGKDKKKKTRKKQVFI
jgi:capsular exopolysaccharide synthesis family protein